MIVLSKLVTISKLKGETNLSRSWWEKRSV